MFCWGRTSSRSSLAPMILNSLNCSSVYPFQMSSSYSSSGSKWSSSSQSSSSWMSPACASCSKYHTTVDCPCTLNNKKSHRSTCKRGATVTARVAVRAPTTCEQEKHSGTHIPKHEPPSSWSTRRKKQKKGYVRRGIISASHLVVNAISKLFVFMRIPLFLPVVVVLW